MKKICVITSTRAEYGLLRPLIFQLKKNKSVQLHIVVTGTHLDKRYGYTLDEIINDGLKPNTCVEIIEDDTKLGVLKTMSNAIQKIGEVLENLKPDVVVLLGDRYETFAIAGTCVILNIPIAHIHGGEVTYGAYDDMFRHSITKMSNLHFTSSEEYKKRVIQLGEDPKTVYNVGALGVENIKKIDFLSKEQINNELNIDVGKTFLATFHPVTMENATQKEQFIELLDALIEQDKYFTLFTRANADTNSGELNLILDKYCAKYPNKLKAVANLGAVRYLSVMKYCAGVIGNSSSGIIEAPSFNVATINIGNRQKGRIQAKSILNCEAKKKDILNAMQIITKEEFRQILKEVKNPYEGENTAYKISKEIEKFVNNFNKPKIFYDIEVK